MQMEIALLQNVTIDIQTDSTPTIIGDTNTVYEKGLDDSIDNSEVTSGKFKVTSPDGIDTLTIGGVVLTQAELLATKYNTIKIQLIQLKEH